MKNYKVFPKTPDGFRKKLIKDKETGKKVERVAFYPIEPNIIDVIDSFYDRYRSLVSFPDVKDCIRPHLEERNGFFVKIDVKDAFGSVDIENGFDVLTGVVKSSHLKNSSKYLFHKDGGLIQGVRTSSFLFEMYCNLTIDEELQSYCRKRGVCFTRYRDDLIFSSRRPIPRNMRRVFRKIMRRHHLYPNPKKDYCKCIYNNVLEVLGTEVNRSKVSISLEYLQKILDIQEKEGFNKDKVSGMRKWATYVDSINPR